jgi:tetratricopeptide (TPR) repeat protein
MGCSNDKMPITTDNQEALTNFLQGRELVEKVRVEDARDYFERAVAIDSSFALAWLYLSFIQPDISVRYEYIEKARSLTDQVSEGEKICIMATYANFQGDEKGREKYLQELVDKYPNDERVVTDLGNFYFERHNFDKAMVYYKRAITINPEFSTPYNQMGYSYRYQDNFSAAEDAFKKYIKLIPDDPNPYDSYAELLLKMGEFDVSIETYKKSLEIDPDFTPSHFGVASNLIYMREYAKARNQLKRLSKIATTDDQISRAHYGCAIAYLAEGDLEKGIEEIDVISELAIKNSNSIGVIRNYLLKSWIYYEFGELKKAKESADKGYELLQMSVLPQEIKNNLKRVYHIYNTIIEAKQGNLEEAKKSTEEYASLIKNENNEERIRTHNLLKGIVAYSNNNYEAALSDLQNSQLHEPMGMYWLGMTEVALGDSQAAIKYFEDLLKYNGLATVQYVLLRKRAEKELARLKAI